MRKSLLTFAVLSLLIVGCAGAVTQAPPPTPTQFPGTLLPVTEAPPEVTATERQLGGPQLTAQAMMESVTLTAPTATVSLDEAGYSDVVERACTIVRENYVRGNFNGVDWEAVCEQYRQRVEQVETDEELYDLLDEMIAELGDQHSRFVSPDSFAREFSLPTTGGGRPTTGIQMWPGPAREWEQLHLWHVCEQSPAASAGVRRGDILLEVNGLSVQAQDGGFDSAVLAQAIIGDGQSDQVELTLLQGPNSEARQINVGLGPVGQCDGWRYGLLSADPRIGYLRIADFAGDAASNIMDLIDEMEVDGPLDGLVLDVRHNPGGNSDEAIGIFTTGVFGQIGKLREDATQTIYRIRGPVDWNETTPVALLTDGASHSAAEYFATALQQSERATLVGMPTAGNTEGITGFNLPGGSLIRLAVQTLQLPDGSTLEQTGVQPDREVPVGMWGLRQQPDVQVQAAYEALTGEPVPGSE